MSVVESTRTIIFPVSAASVGLMNRSSHCNAIVHTRLCTPLLLQPKHNDLAAAEDTTATAAD